MTVSPIHSSVSSVAYTIDTSSAEGKKVSLTNEPSSSFHEIVVIHPGSQEETLAPANSEAVLNEEKPPSEIPVEETQNIFNRIFCCCQK